MWRLRCVVRAFSLGVLATGAFSLAPEPAFAQLAPALDTAASKSALGAELSLLPAYLRLTPATLQRLQLPAPWLTPLRVSFSDRAVPGFELLRLPTYRHEVSLTRGPLSLVAFQYAAVGPELDCRVVCEPTIERAAGVETRLKLGGVGPIRSTHVFAGPQMVWTPKGYVSRFRVGLGGVWD